MKYNARRAGRQQERREFKQEFKREPEQFILVKEKYKKGRKSL